jgi:hypothetical protein
MRLLAKMKASGTVERRRVGKCPQIEEYLLLWERGEAHGRVYVAVVRANLVNR